MTSILLVYDVKGWSWHKMAQGIQKYAPDDIDVEIMDQIEFGKINAISKTLRKYDAICQFSWAEASTGIRFNKSHSTLVAAHGIEYKYPPEDASYYPSRIATRIRNINHAKGRMPLFDRVLCVNDSLYEEAGKLGAKAVRVVPGVDHEVFVPSESPKEGKFTIGWCGQRRGETKGYNEILVPLMEELSELDIEWKINDRDQSDALSTEEMVSWYQSLDLLISTSFSEGFQMTILEAMSCGVLALATDCGGASECAPTMPPYYDSNTAITTIEAFKSAMLGYVNRRTATHLLGEMQRTVIEKKFTWKQRSKEWLEAML